MKFIGVKDIKLFNISLLVKGVKDIKLFTISLLVKWKGRL